MALPDLTGQNIQDTYQRVLQTDITGSMRDGTGSLFLPQSASYAISASYAETALIEITKEVSSSYAETASMSSTDFIIQGKVTASDGMFPTTHTSRIYETGSTSRFIDFNGANINIWNSTNAIAIGSSEVEINAGHYSRDFIVKGTNGDNTLFVDGSAEKVGIGTNTPNVKLHVRDGDLHATNITASGDVNMTGSLTINSGEIIGSGSEVGINVGGYLWASASNGHITASGNISSSGMLIASHSNLPDIGGQYQISGYKGVWVQGGDFVFGNTSFDTKVKGTTINLQAPVTASGDISASGNIIGGGLNINGTTTFNDGNITNVGRINLDSIQDEGENGTFIHMNPTNIQVSVAEEDEVFTIGPSGHITASGAISASGDVYADAYYSEGQAVINYVPGQDRIQIGNKPTLIQGAAFANSHISASGNISGSVILGAQLEISSPTGNSSILNGIIETSGDIIVGAGTVSALSASIDQLAPGPGGVCRLQATEITASGNITASGYIYAGGDIHAVGDVVASSTTPSDYRLKENIKPIENSLEKVLNLDGKEFNWINTGKSDFGLIAQDVEKIIPRLVKEKNILGEEETKKVVNYISIIPLLVESIKELNNKIEELRNE